MSAEPVSEPNGTPTPPGSKASETDREPFTAYVRRRWRSRARHRGSTYWLFYRGTPLAATFVALYAINGVWLGWDTAYDVTVAIVSPADTKHPAVAWPLSLAGWLFAPGLAGAIAGYVVSASIGAHRRIPVSEAFEGDDRAG